MSKSLPQFWTELRQRVEKQQSGYALAQLAHNGNVTVFAAYQASHLKPGFVVQMPQELKPQNLNRQSSEKLQLVEEFSGLGQGMTAIGLFLKDPDFIDLFEILVSEIVDEIVSATSSEKACSSVVRCIVRWRLFLERNGLPLSEVKIRGLIGELSVLKMLLGRLSPIEALDAWQGPYGVSRDFELPNYAIEVKTCVISDGATVTINRPEQLDTQEIRPVFLLVAAVEKNNAMGLTLGEFVEMVAQSFSDTECKSLYIDRLAAAGYAVTDSRLYLDRYAVSEHTLYKVIDGFPRISSDQIPPGVTDVKFKIALAALSQFEVSLADVME